MVVQQKCSALRGWSTWFQVCIQRPWTYQVWTCSWSRAGWSWEWSISWRPSLGHQSLSLFHRRNNWMNLKKGVVNVEVLVVLGKYLRQVIQVEITSRKLTWDISAEEDEDFKALCVCVCMCLVILLVSIFTGHLLFVIYYARHRGYSCVLILEIRTSS